LKTKKEFIYLVAGTSREDWFIESAHRSETIAAKNAQIMNEKHDQAYKGKKGIGYYYQVMRIELIDDEENIKEPNAEPNH